MQRRSVAGCRRDVQLPIQGLESLLHADQAETAVTLFGQDGRNVKADPVIQDGATDLLVLQLKPNPHTAGLSIIKYDPIYLQGKQWGCRNDRERPNMNEAGLGVIRYVGKGDRYGVEIDVMGNPGRGVEGLSHGCRSLGPSLWRCPLMREGRQTGPEDVQQI